MQIWDLPGLWDLPRTYQVSEVVVGVRNHPPWQSAGWHGHQNHHLEAAELQED